MTGDGAKRRIPILERRLPVLGVYSVVTVAMTWPLALRWQTALPAGAGDLWQNYWNLWWWKECLQEGLNPLHSPLLFHPFGVDLVFHTHSPFNQILSMPVNLAFGEAAAYNFCVLLALTVSGFGTYLLVRELTGHAPSAFLAGLVFAYFPQAMEQTLEHLNLFSLQFIPLSLHYMLRWSRTRRLADALAFGTCFGLNALCSWHLGLKLALVATPWIVCVVWRNREQWKPAIRDLGAAAGLATLFVLPVLVPMISLIAGGADYYVKQPVSRGIDPSYLLTPVYANPLLGALIESRYLDRAYQASGFVCYLGVVPVVLAVLAIWRRGRQTAPWLAIFGGGLILALGSNLLWDGTRYASVPLPFGLLEGLPLLENLRVANRFLLVAALGLAVLAGYGWASLRMSSGWTFTVAVLLVLAEYSWLPFPTRQIEFSPLLNQVAERPGAVLDIPLHQRNRTVHNMAHQTVHGRPIADGYLSAYPPQVETNLAELPAVSQLAGVPEPSATVAIEALLKSGFRTVVIHKHRAASFREDKLASLDRHDVLELKRIRRLGGVPDTTIASLRQQLDQALGGAALEDHELAVYFLDASKPTP